LEVDDLTLFSTKVDAMTQRLDRSNVNAVNSCEICALLTV